MVEHLLLIFAILSIEIYLYVVRVVNEGKKLPSISESWYVMQEKGYGKKWFTFALWGFAGPICYLAAYNEHWTMMSAASLIMLVGVAPAFKLNRYEKTVHYVGAFGGAGLGLVSLWLEYGMFYWSMITIVAILFGTVKMRPDKWKLEWEENVYWLVETIIIRSVYIYLFLESVWYHVFTNLFLKKL